MQRISAGKLALLNTNSSPVIEPVEDFWGFLIHLLCAQQRNEINWRQQLFVVQAGGEQYENNIPLL